MTASRSLESKCTVLGTRAIPCIVQWQEGINIEMFCGRKASFDPGLHVSGSGAQSDTIQLFLTKDAASGKEIPRFQFLSVF